MRILKILNLEENLKLENDNTQLPNERLVGKKIDEKTLETNIPNQLKISLRIQIKFVNPIKNLFKYNQSGKIEITSLQDIIELANQEKN